MSRKAFFLLGIATTLLVFGVIAVYPHMSIASANAVVNTGMNAGTANNSGVAREYVHQAALEATSQHQIAPAEAPWAQPIARLLSLADKANQTLITPGWIYIKEVAEGDTDLKRRGSLPNGQEIPIAYTNEIWYHLDDQHRVFEFVAIQRDAHGQIVQIGVYTDGVGWNSATNETTVLEPFVLTTLDYGIARQWKSTAAASPVKVMESVLDDKPVVLFSNTEHHSKPLLMAEYDQAVIATEGRAYLDPVTGQLVRREIVAHLADGTQRVVSRITLEIKPDVAPAAEVLELLAGRKPVQ